MFLKKLLRKWFLFNCSDFLGEKWGAWKCNLHLNPEATQNYYKMSYKAMLF